jgi:hypothetical protein
MRHFLRLARMRTLLALAAAILLAASAPATANFLDNDADFSLALSLLRPAIGERARVLRVEVDVQGVVIEAQDPRNRSHVDRWRYGFVSYLGLLSLRRLSGPEAVHLNLINPDLDANLFDLDFADKIAGFNLRGLPSNPVSVRRKARPWYAHAPAPGARPDLRALQAFMQERFPRFPVPAALP